MIRRAVDYRRERWRNGGGWTRQIAAGSLAQPVFGEGAGAGDWDWRLSIAEIEADGPFSLFPGVDRTLLLLSGAGMEIVCEGGLITRLSAPLDRFDFAGEPRIAARLHDGPTVDFNLMSRRDVVSAQLQVVSAEAAMAALATPAWLTVVHLLAGRAVTSGTEIGAGDTLLATARTESNSAAPSGFEASGGAVTVLAPGSALLIGIEPTLVPAVTAPPSDVV